MWYFCKHWFSIALPAFTSDAPESALPTQPALPTNFRTKSTQCVCVKPFWFATNFWLTDVTQKWVICFWSNCVTEFFIKFSAKICTWNTLIANYSCLCGTGFFIYRGQTWRQLAYIGSAFSFVIASVFPFSAAKCLIYIVECHITRARFD
jgi:hypothetical protein